MSANSYLFARPPQWQLPLPYRQQHLSAELQSWLAETGSLTKRLRGIYGKKFAVKVLFQQWKPAYIDECRLLAIPASRYQLVREVMLYADRQPLVLARTILPLETIKTAHRNLSHLGTRPLGEVIFAYPDLERRERQYSCANVNNWTGQIQTHSDINREIWGRRTVYAIHQQPLLVAEFFLPGMLNRL